MSDSKSVFKKNIMIVTSNMGIRSGTFLSKLISESSINGVTLEKTYCNSLLNHTLPPVNLSLDKADALCSALGIPLHRLVNPRFEHTGVTEEDFVISTKLLSECIQIAKSVADENGLDHNFMGILASNLYLLKLRNAEDKLIYSIIVQLVKEYTC
jgi:hypothetical protein